MHSRFTVCSGKGAREVRTDGCRNAGTAFICKQIQAAANRPITWRRQRLTGDLEEARQGRDLNGYPNIPRALTVLAGPCVPRRAIDTPGSRLSRSLPARVAQQLVWYFCTLS
jgi:hypothetical protein